MQSPTIRECLTQTLSSSRNLSLPAHWLEGTRSLRYAQTFHGQFLSSITAKTDASLPDIDPAKCVRNAAKTIERLSVRDIGARHQTPRLGTPMKYVADRRGPHASADTL
jgi:hypothetical protein